jgi:hypothetical protein
MLGVRFQPTNSASTVSASPHSELKPTTVEGPSAFIAQRTMSGHELPKFVICPQRAAGQPQIPAP